MRTHGKKKKNVKKLGRGGERGERETWWREKKKGEHFVSLENVRGLGKWKG